MSRFFARRHSPVMVFWSMTILVGCIQEKTGPTETAAPSNETESPPAPGVSTAGPLDAYYSSIDSTSRMALRRSLHNLIDDHKRQSYSMVWTVLEKADEDPANATHILDVYRNQSFPKG